jgi:hypothetical protein
VKFVTAPVAKVFDDGRASVPKLIAAVAPFEPVDMALSGHITSESTLHGLPLSGQFAISFCRERACPRMSSVYSLALPVTGSVIGSAGMAIGFKGGS